MTTLMREMSNFRGGQYQARTALQHKRDARSNGLGRENESEGRLCCHFASMSLQHIANKPGNTSHYLDVVEAACEKFGCAPIVDESVLHHRILPCAQLFCRVQDTVRVSRELCRDLKPQRYTVQVESGDKSNLFGVAYSSTFALSLACELRLLAQSEGACS